MRDLETRLRQVGRALHVPPTPPIAARARSAIERRSRQRPVPALAFTVAIVVVVAAVVAFPSSRSAAADVLGIGGVRVMDVLPVADPAGPFDLGRRIDLAEVSVPMLPRALGPPDEVWLDDRGAADVVTLIYGGSVEGGSARVLVTVLIAGLRVEVVGKGLGPATTLEFIEVRGREGMWFSGGPHPVAILGPGGAVIIETGRLAANALVWEEGGVTYRIETSAPLSIAIEIAKSMRLAE